MKYILFQNLSKRQLKKTVQSFLWKKKNTTSQASTSTLHLELGILDIGTQLSYPELKFIQRLFNSTNDLLKGLILYQLILELDSNQGLAL